LKRLYPTLVCARENAVSYDRTSNDHSNTTIENFALATSIVCFYYLNSSRSGVSYFALSIQKQFQYAYCGSFITEDN